MKFIIYKCVENVLIKFDKHATNRVKKIIEINLHMYRVKIEILHKRDLKVGGNKTKTTFKCIFIVKLVPLSSNSFNLLVSHLYQLSYVLIIPRSHAMFYRLCIMKLMALSILGCLGNMAYEQCV